MSAKPAKEQVILALKSRKTLFITIFIPWFIYIQLVEKRLNKKGLIYKFWRRKNIKIGKYYTYSLAVARKYNINVFKKVSTLTLTIVILTGVLKRSLVFDSLQKCRINDEASVCRSYTVIAETIDQKCGQFSLSVFYLYGTFYLLRLIAFRQLSSQNDVLT